MTQTSTTHVRAVDLPVEEQYLRALERATKHGVHVVARGIRHADGASVYFTNSSSEPGGSHTVVVEPHQLVCDCPARVVCTHRAVVHAALALKARTRRHPAPIAL